MKQKHASRKHRMPSVTEHLGLLFPVSLMLRVHLLRSPTLWPMMKAFLNTALQKSRRVADKGIRGSEKR